jgi:hypothetical protein
VSFDFFSGHETETIGLYVSQQPDSTSKISELLDSLGKTFGVNLQGSAQYDLNWVVSQRMRFWTMIC